MPERAKISSEISAEISARALRYTPNVGILSKVVYGCEKLTKKAMKAQPSWEQLCKKGSNSFKGVKGGGPGLGTKGKKMKKSCATDVEAEEDCLTRK